MSTAALLKLVILCVLVLLLLCCCCCCCCCVVSMVQTCLKFCTNKSSRRGIQHNVLVFITKW
eukprot:SAG22_NODE_1070_length_5723_cov_2.407539_5_plen_62_part_00